MLEGNGYQSEDMMFSLLVSFVYKVKGHTVTVHVTKVTYITYFKTPSIDTFESGSYHSIFTLDCHIIDLLVDDLRRFEMFHYVDTSLFEHTVWIQVL